MSPYCQASRARRCATRQDLILLKDGLGVLRCEGGKCEVEGCPKGEQVKQKLVLQSGQGRKISGQVDVSTGINACEGSWLDGGTQG